MKPASDVGSDVQLLGPFDSLRDFMLALEARGKVIHIAEIDQDQYEATAVMYRLIDHFGWTGAPALIADRVKVDGEWMDGPFIANQYGDWDSAAFALGLEPPTEDRRENYRAAVAHCIELAGETGQWKTIEPVEVSEDQAPCKIVKLTGDEIDILKFPFVQSNPADGGRFINTGNLIMVDPERGRNVGTYRCHIKGPRKIAINPEKRQHGWQFLQDAKERGEKIVNAALVLGTDPIVYAMSCSKTARLGQDELAIAGGFLGKPVEVVKCETSDILVPANAEMVIEGEIPVDEFISEGPFGEMYAYMGHEKSENYYMNITAVTHRRKPWFVNQFTGVTPGFLTAPTEATGNVAFRQLIPNLVGFHLPIELTGFCFLSIDKKKPGEAFEAGREILKFLNIAKILVVVDKDVDILNTMETLHAMGARWQPHSASEIIEDGLALRLDPSIREVEREKLHPKSSKIIVDATRQWPEEGGPDVYPRLSRDHLAEEFPNLFAEIDEKMKGLLE